MYKVETRKKFRIHASNIVCGVRGGGLDPYELENAPEMQVSQDFVHDCSFFFFVALSTFSLPFFPAPSARPHLYLHSLSVVPQVK